MPGYTESEDRTGPVKNAAAFDAIIKLTKVLCCDNDHVCAHFLKCRYRPIAVNRYEYG
jgi:hypothetical protein